MQFHITPVKVRAIGRTVKTKETQTGIALVMTKSNKCGIKRCDFEVTCDQAYFSKMISREGGHDRRLISKLTFRALVIGG